jgi:hypothetical protein
MCTNVAMRHIRAMAKPTRRDRYVDLGALFVIVFGVVLYMDGTARLRGIQKFSYAHPGPVGVSQLRAADLARYGANGGITLAVAGCVMGAVSAIRVARRRPGLS